MLWGEAGGGGAGEWWFWLRYGALSALLLLAAVSDLKRHRIGNRLILTGLAVAFLFHFAFPLELGWWRGLQGLLLGFAMFLPFYLLRGMAAGDVKLMAMAGAFLGPYLTFWAVVATFLVGGVWAVVLVLRRRAWPKLIGNLRTLATHGGGDGLLGASGGSVGRLPYAVAVAIGTIAVVILKHLVAGL